MRERASESSGLRHQDWLCPEAQIDEPSLKRKVSAAQGQDQTQHMVEHAHFPPPWSVEEQAACFVVTDSSGQKFAHLSRLTFAKGRHDDCGRDDPFLGEAQSCAQPPYR
jgi:hypothetical protein